MANDLTAAIIGSGFIGTVHRDALRRLGVPIRGVLGSSASRSTEVAADWGVEAGYASLDELVADPDVDVVHITSPNDRHVEQALAAIAAGKHVVCEKPLALSSDDTARLTRAASEAGVVAAVNFNIRFYPLVRESRERVRSGSLGDVRLVTGVYLQDWLSRADDWNWRIDDTAGGPFRALGDIGTHWLDLISYVLGSPVVEVFADTATFLPVRRRPTSPTRTFDAAAGPAEDVAITTEDAASVLLRFANGARGSVTVSQVSPGRKNGIRFEISGSDASLAWAGERPDELWIGHRDRPNETLLRDPALLTPYAAEAARVPGGHAEGFESTFAALYTNVYRRIRDAGSPVDFPVFADGHTESLVLDAISRSVDSGTWDRVRHDDLSDPEGVAR